MHRHKLFMTQSVSQCNNNYGRIIITVQLVTVVEISAVATFRSKQGKFIKGRRNSTTRQNSRHFDFVKEYRTCQKKLTLNLT